MPSVEVRTNAQGYGTIVVDGVDLSNAVRSVKIDIQCGEATGVTLHIPDTQLLSLTEVQEKMIKRIEDAEKLGRTTVFGAI